MSLDDNLTTTYNNEIFTTEESVVTNISCDPTCYSLVKPTSDDVDLTTKLIYSLVIILLASVIASSLVIFLRFYRYSQKQQKKEKDFLQDTKIHAHPFEDIVVIVDEPKSIELTDIRPTTIAN
ncbi:hypothetical protein I4U23_027845 [Adineta vaga]|nr:hypothetical protein I4U23_027845 [Adineta vaga]